MKVGILLVWLLYFHNYFKTGQHHLSTQPLVTTVNLKLAHMFHYRVISNSSQLRQMSQNFYSLRDSFCVCWLL